MPRTCPPCLALLTGALLIGLAPPAPAAEGGGAEGESAATDALKTERWTASTYGISMRPPKDTKAIQHTADKAIVKFAGDNTTYSFYLRHTKQDVNLKQLRDRGVQQFTFAYSKAVMLKDRTRRLKIAGRQSVKLYFLVPEEEGADWVAGQAYMLLDSTTVAVFQLQCAAEALEAKKRAFEQMLHSVRLEDPKKLTRRREQLLEAAKQWRRKIDVKQLQKTWPKEQWFRITKKGEDIGYMRRQLKPGAKALGQRGLGLVVQKRIFSGGKVFDTQNEFFLTGDGQGELWSRRRTRRMREDVERGKRQRLPGAGRGPKTVSLAETGNRDGDRVSVHRQTPTSIDQNEWKTPPTYLSQLGTQMLMPLRAHEKERRLLFYAYHPPSEKITLRQVHVQPLKDGRYRVRVRPAPGRGERVSLYSAESKLIRTELPDGRVIVPATRKEMRKVWNLPAEGLP